MINPPASDQPQGRPWTVIVRDRIVVARYRAEDSFNTDGRVTVTSFGDGPVAVFEVDDHFPAPPNVGEVVDPQALGWLQINRSEPDEAPGPPVNEAALIAAAKLPEQRQHAGERYDKCNPERDAKPPLFANQVDPPPQRPWPATSDEGNSVPLPVKRKAQECTNDSGESEKNKP